MEKPYEYPLKLDRKKMMKFKAVCAMNNTDMASVLRQFIHKTIRKPKECLDFIKQDS